MDPSLDLSQRLADERRLLNRLRDDYAAITNSRFHAFRMLWFSVKCMLGLRKAGDVFEVSSPARRGGDITASAVGAVRVSNTRLSSDDADLPGPAPSRADLTRLFDLWRERAESLAEPLVSIIIPVYNNADVTVRCLLSVADRWPLAFQCQVIVVDDCSRDSTSAIMSQLPGIDYVRNAANSGFIRSCNRGAAIARGRYVCFLNNDTIVGDGWLDELVRAAESDGSVGAVGAKLVYPDGTLQEAGGIIWRDGSGWNYGRGEDPRDPKYNFVRDVDYCSGAALLVRTQLFREIGGFSELYAPAYYEDVDLCFGLRQRGYRVVYQPLSIVVHDEGTSSGVSTESGIKRYQTINAPKFVDKWSLALEKHEEHDPKRSIFAARRLGRRNTIMLIDNYVPEFDKDAGSDRMFNLIRLFQEIGYDIIFVPDNHFRSEPYTTTLQRQGVEVIYGTDNSVTQVDLVRERLPLVDLVWVSRPDIGARWMPLVRERSDLPIIYDTVDLHYVRLRRKLEAENVKDAETWATWERHRASELDVIRSADLTIAIAEGEQRILADEGITNTFVVPTMHRIHRRSHPFAETSGLLFIGGFQHPPNGDAAIWLCQEIMPLIWEHLPAVKLTLLGSNPTDEIRALSSDRISVPGYLPDVNSYFATARVFVAPLRFGAGLKAKVGHAFGYGLPTVTTAIGAEGFGIHHDKDALIADDARSFARLVVRLHEDEVLWNRIAENSMRTIEAFTPEAIGRTLPLLVKRAGEHLRAGHEALGAGL